MAHSWDRSDVIRIVLPATPMVSIVGPTSPLSPSAVSFAKRQRLTGVSEEDEDTPAAHADEPVVSAARVSHDEVTPAPPEVPVQDRRADLLRFSVKELQGKCEAVGLPKTGSKADLIKRLVARRR